MARKNLEIPVWRKYTLSIEEAAQYWRKTSPSDNKG